MKILNLKIYNPEREEIRNIDFKTSGASVIYGKIAQPTKKKKTTNSIGKTLLLKFIGYIFGKKEKKTDYSERIKGWHLEAKVLHKGKKYIVERTLGDTSTIKINDENFSYNNYIKFFDVDQRQNSRQILLSRRQGIISDVSPKPTKEETTTVLKLLRLNNIIDLFVNMRNTQEKVKAISDYSKHFEDALKNLKEKEFLLEQEKNKKAIELEELSKRIKSLRFTKDSVGLVELHAEKSYQLKTLKIQQENLKAKIMRINGLIEEMKHTDLSSNDVIKIYDMAQVDIPDMVKRTIEEVQKFYDEMFGDKINKYSEDIKKYNQQIENLEERIDKLTPVVDDLATKIADSNLFSEAVSLYQIKNEELSKIESEYNQIVGSISNLSEKKHLQNEINQKYISLEEKMKENTDVIKKYRQYLFDLVNEVYGEDHVAFFDINVSQSSRRVESSPIVFEMNLNGEFGEGIGAVKNLLMDLLIFYFNDRIEYLIQDSACFEGIDKRQLSTLISIINKTAVKIDKQYIFSINEYHVDKTDEELKTIIKDRTALELSEDDTLLKFRF